MECKHGLPREECPVCRRRDERFTRAAANLLTNYVILKLNEASRDFEGFTQEMGSFIGNALRRLLAEDEEERR